MAEVEEEIVPWGDPMGLADVGSVRGFHSWCGGNCPTYLLVGVGNVFPVSWLGIVDDDLPSDEALMPGVLTDVGARGGSDSGGGWSWFRFSENSVAYLLTRNETLRWEILINVWIVGGFDPLGGVSWFGEWGYHQTGFFVAWHA